jgi:hypothetical protein
VISQPEGFELKSLKSTLYKWLPTINPSQDEIGYAIKLSIKLAEEHYALRTATKTLPQ